MRVTSAALVGTRKVLEYLVHGRVPTGGTSKNGSGNVWCRERWLENGHVAGMRDVVSKGRASDCGAMAITVVLSVLGVFTPFLNTLASLVASAPAINSLPATLLVLALAMLLLALVWVRMAMLLIIVGVSTPAMK